MGVTEVYRGVDLLDSTPRQIYLQRLLGYPTPVYAHAPLVLGPDGEKLNKRHRAPDLSSLRESGADPRGVVSALARSVGVLDQKDTWASAQELVEAYEHDKVRSAGDSRKLDLDAKSLMRSA